VTISAFGLVTMCFTGTWQALGPLVVRREYGHIGLFGVFVAIYGLGSVAGSVAGSAWHPRRPLRDTLALAVLWPAIALVVALHAPVWAVGAWMLLGGLQSGLFVVVWETALARHVPPEALSRVSAYDWMGSLALLPLGYLLAGPLAGVFGARAVLGAGGAIGMLVTLVALSPRSTRELADEPAGALVPAPASGPAPEGETLPLAE